jgi:hypothetical protein
MSIRPSRQRLIDDLKANKFVALGDETRWPRSPLKSAGEAGNSLKEARAIVRAAMTSTRLRVAKLRGESLMLNPNADQQTELLTLIAKLLPRSYILCLNIGEFPAARLSAYELIVQNLPESFVGNMYWDSGKGPNPAPDLVPDARHILKENRRKDFFRLELMRPEVFQFARHGCHAWWDIQEKRIDGKKGCVNVAREMIENTKPIPNPDAPGFRCKVGCKQSRCKGLNSAKKRCCLCTRHESGYCHHHRKKPYPVKTSKGTADGSSSSA